jgi:hypothetical protein
MRVLVEHPNLVEVSYFDAWNDSQFCVGDDRWVKPGNVTCAIYRWRQP